MKNTPGPLQQAFEVTLREQQARLSVPLAALRFGAICVWWLLGVTNVWIVALVPVGLYALSAGAVLLAMVLRPALRNRAAWTLPLLDVPLLFVSQLVVLERAPEAAGFTAALSASLFLVVTLLAMLTFERKLLWSVGALATLAATSLIVIADREILHGVPTVLLLMTTAVLAAHKGIGLVRVLTMDLATQQQRQARLSRYFKEKARERGQKRDAQMRARLLASP